jgi:hypothetical protein
MATDTHKISVLNVVMALGELNLKTNPQENVKSVL